MSHDRSDDDTFALTQGYLADMLGVCRSTVTLAAGALQRAGLIRYRRGAITVLDRPGLEAASCECYRVIREQYERLLPRTAERRSSRRQLSGVGQSFVPQGVVKNTAPGHRSGGPQQPPHGSRYHPRQRFMG
jgi:DNA-binding transcriptional MocR family regulator